jgi:hypothetical protein
MSDEPAILQNLVDKVLPWNPSMDMREKFIWATSHILTWTAEERTEVRLQPSLSVDYKIHILSDARLDEILEFYRVNQGKQIRVPLWSSPQQLRDLTSGQTVIPLDASSPLRAYLADTAEVIFWSSPERFEVHQIASIAVDSVTLGTPLLNGFSVCYLMPSLTGLFSGSPVTRGQGSRRAWNFTFVCHSVYLAEYAYAIDDYFEVKPLQSSDFSTLLSQEHETISAPLGVQTKVALEGITRQTWGCTYSTTGFAETTLLKQKLAYFRGKARKLKFPFVNLNRVNPDTFVSLTEDSLTFTHSPRYQCSVTVGFTGNLVPPVSSPFDISVSEPFKDLNGVIIEIPGGTELIITGGVLFIGVDPWSDYNKTLVINPQTGEQGGFDPQTGEQTRIEEFTVSVAGTGQGNIIGDGTNIWATNLHHSLYLVDITPPGSLTELMFAGIFSFIDVHEEYIYALNQRIPDYGWSVSKIEKLTEIGTGEQIARMKFLDNEQHLGALKVDETGVYELGWATAALYIHSLDLDSTEVVPLPAVGSYLTLTPDHIWVTAKPDKLYRIEKATPGVGVSRVIDVFTVSGLESRTWYLAYVEYLPEIGVVVLSRALENKVSLINQFATSGSDLIQTSVDLLGQPRQVAGFSPTEAFVTTSAGTFKLDFLPN